MLDMDFVSFIILLAIAVVVAAIVHYGFKYYAVGGFGSFLSKVVVAWVGGWIGSPVLGHWFGGVNFRNVYIVPAILGSIALTVLAVDAARTFRVSGGG